MHVGNNEVVRISVSMGKKTSTKSLDTILAASLSVLTTTLTFFWCRGKFKFDFGGG